MTASRPGAEQPETDTAWVVDIDGSVELRGEAATDRLGGKGAGLAEMSRAGLPVPPAFVITTDVCRHHLRYGETPDGLHAELRRALQRLESRTGKTFGGGPHPLLLSVRSGAPISMPGMMDTVLNLGVNRSVAAAMGEESGDLRFVGDVVARFYRMYSEVVLGALPDVFDAPVAAATAELGSCADGGAVYDLVWTACAQALRDEEDLAVPEDPFDQLGGAVDAVIRSWGNRRAVTYREHHGIPHDLGTAVVVQAMVFGNLGELSGTGVVFTRDPVNGTPHLYGEFLQGGQGEDVVAGEADPEQLHDVAERFPQLQAQIQTVCTTLEELRGDAQDIEFTVERGELYLLQVRTAKRTARAAVRIAADLHREGTIDLGDALGRLELEHVRELERPTFDPDAHRQAHRDGSLIGAGIGASPGHVSGVVALDSDSAVRLAEQGHSVILARTVTSPLDLHGMIAAAGILTTRGGSTSHAAVVARALGTTGVVGCADLVIDEADGSFSLGGRRLPAGTVLSLDGNTGEVFVGEIPQASAHRGDSHLRTLLDAGAARADAMSLCRVHTPQQAEVALERGADGLTTSIEDLLAARTSVREVIDLLAEQIDREHPDLTAVEPLVRDAVSPLVDVAHGRPVHVRAIDLRDADNAKLLQDGAGLVQHPHVRAPLGPLELLRAQIAGVAQAVDAAGDDAQVFLAVRHVTDPLEVEFLNEMVVRAEANLTVETYADAVRALLLAPQFAARGTFWLDFHALQAAVFGVAVEELEPGSALDEYVKAGLWSSHPRTSVDRSMSELLGLLGRSLEGGLATVGARLSTAVHQDIISDLYGRGVRTFSVNAPELSALRLAIGKAALHPTARVADRHAR